ncbi:MAG: hypothetical protein WBR56_03450 [Sedimenticolaceae bacterium]
MSNANRGEIGDKNELDDREMYPISEPEDIEDFADIDDADQRYEDELDFPDDVFIDNFDYPPPDDDYLPPDDEGRSGLELRQPLCRFDFGAVVEE